MELIDFQKFGEKKNTCEKILVEKSQNGSDF